MDIAIEFLPLEPKDFHLWLRKRIQSYAEGLRLNHSLNQEDAEAQAEQIYAKSLPAGLQSKNQFIYKLGIPAETVGTIWYQTHYLGNAKHGFLCDIEIDPSYRGRGLAKQSLLLMQEKLKALGMVSVGLHVFGTNQKAQKLYASMGFVSTNIFMSKSL